MMISIQMFKDALGLTNDDQSQMFKDSLGLTNEVQYLNV